MCVPLFRRWQEDESRLERIGAFLSRGNRLLLPIFFIILLELCMRPLFHPDAYIIVGDWANVTVYLSVFVFGYVYAADVRIQRKVYEYFKPSMILGAMFLATLYYVNINSQMFYSYAAHLLPLWVLAKGVYECAGIIFLMGLGRLYLNQNSRVLGYLNRMSFKIYVFHYLPVTLFTWLFIKVKMHIFVKYLLVAALSYLTVFIICELWQRVRSNIIQESEALI